MTASTATDQQPKREPRAAVPLRSREGFTIDEYCRHGGPGRSTTYKLMKAGVIKFKKVGKRTILDAATALAVIDPNLPPVDMAKVNAQIAALKKQKTAA